MINSVLRRMKIPRSCQEIPRRGVSVSKLETHWLDMGTDRYEMVDVSTVCPLFCTVNR